MKFKVTWGKKLIAGILLAAVVVGGTAAPAEKQHRRIIPRLWHRIITGKHCAKDFWERVMAVWLMESAVTAVVTHAQP